MNAGFGVGALTGAGIDMLNGSVLVKAKKPDGDTTGIFNIDNTHDPASSSVAVRCEFNCEEAGAIMSDVSIKNLTMKKPTDDSNTMTIAGETGNLSTIGTGTFSSLLSADGGIDIGSTSIDNTGKITTSKRYVSTYPAPANGPQWAIETLGDVWIKGKLRVDGAIDFTGDLSFDELDIRILRIKNEGGAEIDLQDNPIVGTAGLLKVYGDTGAISCVDLTVNGNQVASGNIGVTTGDIDVALGDVNITEGELNTENITINGNFSQPKNDPWNNTFLTQSATFTEEHGGKYTKIHTLWNWMRANDDIMLQFDAVTPSIDLHDPVLGITLSLEPETGNIINNQGDLTMKDGETKIQDDSTIKFYDGVTENMSMDTDGNIETNGELVMKTADSKIEWETGGFTALEGHSAGNRNIIKNFDFTDASNLFPTHPAQEPYEVVHLWDPDNVNERVIHTLHGWVDLIEEGYMDVSFTAKSTSVLIDFQFMASTEAQAHITRIYETHKDGVATGVIWTKSSRLMDSNYAEDGRMLHHIKTYMTGLTLDSVYVVKPQMLVVTSGSELTIWAGGNTGGTNHNPPVFIHIRPTPQNFSIETDDLPSDDY